MSRAICSILPFQTSQSLPEVEGDRHKKRGIIKKKEKEKKTDIIKKKKKKDTLKRLGGNNIGKPY